MAGTAANGYAADEIGGIIVAMVNPYQQYKQNTVQTASPEKLILMLYEGAIKHLKMGKLHIDNKNIEKAHYSLTKVQMIINELISSLNMDYEISGSLFALYDFMEKRVIEANIKKDKEPLEIVLKLLEELRGTWQEAMKKV